MSFDRFVARTGYAGLLAVALFFAALAILPAHAAPVQEQAAAADDVLSRDAVLRDAEIPVLGNPQGDITIVEWFDYQCPFCKKISPVIDQVLSAR